MSLKQKISTRTLVLTALFTALTAVLAQIQLPLGPVPFNLAVFGAYLAGMMLPQLSAAGSMLIYLMLAFIGVPVLAGFTGGPGILFGKTGGYVLGYVLIAFCTAVAAKKGKTIVTAMGMLLGLFGCYALGTIWFMVITGTGLGQSLAWCVFPFIIPDIGKAVCAYLLGKVLSKRLTQARILS